MAKPFISGLELARQFHAEVVGPLLNQSFPGITYSAALIGSGSDVLGFDSARSTDHNWGPRLKVFLPPGEADLAGEITGLLASRLPATFRGWPTAFPDATAASPEPRHWVEVAELGSWLADQLGFDPRRGVTLLGGLGGRDRLGGLGTVRSRLAWYPRDVWLYVLACQWQRISQEEAFPSRCAETGDELGSAVVPARLARDLMRLCLLMQRRYPPYSKWLGTAFAALPPAAAPGPMLVD